MPFPLAALAIMGGAKLAGGLLKKKGQVSAAKEQKRADDANAQARFESDLANESNQEDTRLFKTQGIANQLTGARALSPEVIKAALTRRKSAVRKGVNADRSKGMGWDALGDVAGLASDYAGNFVKGRMMEGGGAEATSLRPQAVNGACPGGYAADGNGNC